MVARSGVGAISTFLSLQDWILTHLWGTVFAVALILGVGVIWPLSDASRRGRLRPLKPANLTHWRAQDTVLLGQACFLWFGHEPPKRAEDADAWLRRNASLRVIRRQMQEAFSAMGSEAELGLDELYDYAKDRERTRGERVPAFLAGRDRAKATDVRSI